MSDDTPTERVEPVAPTTPLAAAAPTTPTTPLPSDDPAGSTHEPKRSRRLLIALIIVGALLVIAVVILLIVLLGGRATPTAGATPTDSSTPSASASPTNSATPSTSPTPSPSATTTTAPAPPPSSGPTLASFASSTDVSCNAANNPIPIAFSWTGTGAAAYFAVGSTNDPKNNGQGWTLPPTGSQADFPADQDILYPCNQATATYTIGVYDNSGDKVVKQLVVTNHGTVG